MTSPGTPGTPLGLTRRPEFRQLELFLKVVETRSFAAAARQLDISQPAVSQAIVRLEEIVGGDLFERRRGAPVALTPIGQAILPSARSLLYTVDRQIGRAIATAQSRSGGLSIGFYPCLTSGPLQAGITAFITERPGVGIRLVEALPRELQRLLNDRAIDIMFVAFLPELASSMLAQERIWEEKLVVVIRDDHPLAKRRGLTWADVSTLPIILRSSDGDYSGHNAILTRMGERPLDCELHDVSRGALFDMVRIGFGATICFESSAISRPGIICMPLEEEHSSATISAVWRRGDGNPIRHSLLNYVRRYATHNVL